MILYAGRLLAVFILVFAMNMEASEASGTGEIQFKQFQYSGSCDGDDYPDCDLYFENVKIVVDGVEQWSGWKTGEDNTNSVDLTSLGTTSVRLTREGAVTISMTIKDKDSGSADDHIITIENEDVDFGTTELGDGWTDKTYSYNNGAQLTIRYRITSCDAHFTGLGCNTCTENYYTATCTRYCAPVAGSYTCTSTGEKVCETWKTGVNCDQCEQGYHGTDCLVYCVDVPGRYSCSDDGTNVCEGHWTGTNCDVCEVHWDIGEDCNLCSAEYYGNRCDRHCAPVVGSYTCSSTGYKVCDTGKAGTNCDQCAYDYYGPDCSVHCVGVQGQYSCSSDGGRVCESHRTGSNCTECSTGYYGSRCSTYCAPTKHYNCTENGEKICFLENTTRENNCGPAKKLDEKKLDISTETDPSEGGLDEKLLVIVGCVAVIVALVTGAVCYIRWSRKKQAGLERRLQEQEPRKVEMGGTEREQQQETLLLKSST